MFLRGARTGSPRRRLARMPPAKMTSMEETQRERGCFLEKGSEPAVILVSSNGAAFTVQSQRRLLLRWLGLKCPQV